MLRKPPAIQYLVRVLGVPEHRLPSGVSVINGVALALIFARVVPPSQHCDDFVRTRAKGRLREKRREKNGMRGRGGGGGSGEGDIARRDYYGISS